MSKYISKEYNRLRGEISGAIDSVPRSTTLSGTITVDYTNSQPKRRPRASFRLNLAPADLPLLDQIREGDYLLNEQENTVQRITGVSAPFGPTNNFATLYCVPLPDSYPAAPAGGTVTMRIVRLSSLGLDRAVRITILNTGGADVPLSLNPGDVIPAGEIYTMVGDRKSLIPLFIDASGGAVIYSDGEISQDPAGGGGGPLASEATLAAFREDAFARFVPFAGPPEQLVVDDTVRALPALPDPSIVGAILTMEGGPIRVGAGGGGANEPTSSLGLIVYDGDIIRAGEISNADLSELTSLRFVRTGATNGIINIVWQTRIP